MINWLKRNVLSKPFAFHVILFAIFPVLFLYAYNIDKTYVEQIVIPLIVAVLGALIVWVLLGLLLRDVRKAALATTLFIILFFGYGRLYQALEDSNIFVPRHAYLLSIILFIWGYCVYFIKKVRGDLKNITMILNVVAVTLVAINLAGIGWHEVNKSLQAAGINRQNIGGAQSSDNATGQSSPDIYCIVLDEYAHPNTMKKYYAYDNGEFIQYLEKMGFFIAKHSQTWSSSSEISDASLLNMEDLSYLGYFEKALPFINNNSVAAYLKARGYQYIYIGIWDMDADQPHNYYKDTVGNPLLTEFTGILMDTTMLRPFYAQLVRGEVDPVWRTGTLSSLDQIKKAFTLKGKKFVFAHILCPHEPFVFGPEGERIASENWVNWADKRYYLGQYIFINNQMKDIVTSILANSIEDPVIIIQSDHGLRGGQYNQGISVGDGEWKYILNAYHLPGGGHQLLYNSISPVNSFRVILNYYFGDKMELIKEKED